MGERPFKEQVLSFGNEGLRQKSGNFSPRGYLDKNKFLVYFDCRDVS